MKVSELVKVANLEVLAMPEPEREVVGGYVGDLLSWVMGRAQTDNLWITIMTNINVLAVASLSDVSAVVIAEGAEIDADIIRKAEEQGINLLRSKLPSYEISVAVAAYIK